MVTKNQKNICDVFFFSEKNFPEDYDSWKLLSIPSEELVVALERECAIIGWFPPADNGMLSVYILTNYCFKMRLNDLHTKMQ